MNSKLVIILSVVFPVLFCIFVAVEFFQIKASIKDQELEKTNVAYSQFVPDKAEVRPGDIVSFTYTRSADVGTYPLLLLTIDSFENQDTGEVFPGETGARVILKEGSQERHARRYLVDYATPGTYVFSGWASSQTNKPTRASYYLSKPFKVTPLPDQEMNQTPGPITW